MKNTYITLCGVFLVITIILGWQFFQQREKDIDIVLYFGDTQTIINSDCSATRMVVRQISPTTDIIDATLQELLRGTTAQDIAMGVSDNFSNASGYIGKNVEPLLSYYKSTSVQDGIATIDFSSGALYYLNNAACIQASVKNPIEKTLRQFPEIKNVQYRIDGKEFIEWDA